MGGEKGLGKELQLIDSAEREGAAPGPLRSALAPGFSAGPAASGRPANLGPIYCAFVFVSIITKTSRVIRAFARLGLFQSF